jgi:hypothetical protein
MLRDLRDRARRVWISWLRFEFRAIAILLPTICLELVILLVLISHVPLVFAASGTVPALLAPSVWRFAAEIGVSLPRAGALGPR